MAYDNEINKSRTFLLEIYLERIEQQHITKILHETWMKSISFCKHSKEWKLFFALIKICPLIYD